MLELKIKQHVYQSITDWTQVQKESLNKYAQTDEENNILEFHFDCEQLINLEDLLFLRNKKVLNVSSRILQQIAYDLVNIVQYNRPRELDATNIWIHPIQPFSQKDIEQNSCEIVFSDIIGNYHYNLDKIKQIVDSLIPKLKIKSKDLEQIKQEISDFRQHYQPKNQKFNYTYNSEIIKQMVSKDYCEQFKQKFGAETGQIIFENLLNYIIKKENGFKLPEQFDKLLENYKLKKFYNFFSQISPESINTNILHNVLKTKLIYNQVHKIQKCEEIQNELQNQIQQSTEDYYSFKQKYQMPNVVQYLKNNGILVKKAQILLETVVNKINNVFDKIFTEMDSRLKNFYKFPIDLGKENLKQEMFKNIDYVLLNEQYIFDFSKNELLEQCSQNLNQIVKNLLQDQIIKLYQLRNDQIISKLEYSEH